MAFAPQTAFDYLRRAYEGDRLGHAYLLIGREAAFEVAGRLAALAVRETDPAAALRHRDVHLVEPESKSRRIVIEQIRELENALRLRASASGGRKVGIVREADRLQVQASNAFLKTLEEPPAQSLLLLLSAQPESLPDTVISRCIRVSLIEPEQESSDEAAALRGLLARQANAPRDLAAAFLFAREFSALLTAARARAMEEGETAFAREQKQYGQTTDGSWLGEREGYFKALNEARYIAARNGLVETLARWWGDVLRCASGESTDTPGAAAMAATLTPPQILRKLGEIGKLREHLERNIQEALAIEVACLRLFGE